MSDRRAPPSEPSRGPGKGIGKSVLIFGATSSIARAVADELARRGWGLFLAGRDQSALRRNAADLRSRYGVATDIGCFDARDKAGHGNLVRQASERMIGLQGFVVASGTLGDAHRAIQDFGAADEIIETNFNGAASVLTHCANFLESRRSGFIVAIASVAGDRGRRGNYVYGSAKAGLAVFLQGLRSRLHSAGVRVITVKPGFVDTPMTFGRVGKWGVASPQYLGRKIANAIEGSAEVIYVPWFWRPIMSVIKALPEKVFKRLTF